MRKLLWSLAPLIGWVFAHMSFAIPVRRLRETDTLMAFHHPKPSYQFHVLLVPKKAVPSLRELGPAESTFLTDLYSTVQSLVDEFQLPAWRLIVNGGEYQDFPQLHFHLISPSPQPLFYQERSVRRIA
ncbi:MAG TPA: HIT domain-containing protein [Anaerolineales bacterium]|nr:HIT domain-containing protein [Anaerolineales bacterium]